MYDFSEIRNFYLRGFPIVLTGILRPALLLLGIYGRGGSKDLLEILGFGREGEVCPSAYLT